MFASMYCTQLLVPSVSVGVPLFPSNLVESLFSKDMGLIPLATEDCFSSPVAFFFFLFNGLLTKTLIFYSLNLLPLSLTILRISRFSAIVCTEPALEIIVCTCTINQSSVAGLCSDFWRFYFQTEMQCWQSRDWRVELNGMACHSLCLSLESHSSLL